MVVRSQFSHRLMIDQRQRQYVHFPVFRHCCPESILWWNKVLLIMQLINGKSSKSVPRKKQGTPDSFSTFQNTLKYSEIYRAFSTTTERRRCRRLLFSDYYAIHSVASSNTSSFVLCSVHDILIMRRPIRVSDASSCSTSRF